MLSKYGANNFPNNFLFILESSTTKARLCFKGGRFIPSSITITGDWQARLGFDSRVDSSGRGNSDDVTCGG